MKDLVWFSVPGAIALAAFCLGVPGVSSVSPALLIGAAPMLGFILHQAYRTLFEACGGWESRHRTVLTRIQEVYGIPTTERRLAYLIWETTVYSDGIPAAFLSHNRGAWQYVMGFRSMSLAAGLSAGFLCRLTSFRSSDKCPNLVLLGFAGVALLFWLKGRLTHRSLVRQEVAAFNVYRSAFDSVHTRMRAAEVGSPAGTPVSEAGAGGRT